jgi:polyphosphate kinase
MAKRKGKHSKNGGDGPERMKRKVYDEKLHKLQVELSQLQEWVKQKGLRVIIAFEGRDAAGKGGTIRAITERVSPRVFRVVALPAPSERQKTQLFLQRYIEQFPAAGESSSSIGAGTTAPASSMSWGLSAKRGITAS